VGDSVGDLSERLDHLGAEIEMARGRSHAEWLDHWVESCKERYAIFIDSDVFFHRQCWVTPLMARLQAGSSLVSVLITDLQPGSIEPVRGAVTTAMPRAVPWLLAADVNVLRELRTSFGYINREVDGTTYAYDIGALIFERLVESGCEVAEAPGDYSRFFTHVGGMSWRPEPSAREEQKRWFRRQRARFSLWALRRGRQGLADQA
jgi:hypothetical protein